MDNTDFVTKENSLVNSDDDVISVSSDTDSETFANNVEALKLEAENLSIDACQDAVVVEKAAEEPSCHDQVEETLRIRDETLSEDQKNSCRKEAAVLKEIGNKQYLSQQYQEALITYSQALLTCPLLFSDDRAVFYSNRAAVKMRLEKYDDACEDCTKAIELNMRYVKAYLRRAECYEKIDKLEDALTDYQKIIEIDPSIHQARAACMRLPDEIKVKNEKLKNEMIDKLKELGNMVLRPFGLSTENFKVNQDPNSGGYSINFQQNPQS